MKSHYNYSEKELRNFGLTMAAMVVIVFSVVLPFIFDLAHKIWPLVVAALFIILSLFIPKALGIFYVFWHKIGHILGEINTKIILGILYYIVFTPIGILLRIFKIQLLSKKIDSRLLSYRVASQKTPREHMEHPF